MCESNPLGSDHRDIFLRFARLPPVPPISAVFRTGLNRLGRMLVRQWASSRRIHAHSLFGVMASVTLLEEGTGVLGRLRAPSGTALGGRWPHSPRWAVSFMRTSRRRMSPSPPPSPTRPPRPPPGGHRWVTRWGGGKEGGGRVLGLDLASGDFGEFKRSRGPLASTEHPGIVCAA